MSRTEAVARIKRAFPDCKVEERGEFTHVHLGQNLIWFYSTAISGYFIDKDCVLTWDNTPIEQVDEVIDWLKEKVGT